MTSPPYVSRVAEWRARRRDAAELMTYDDTLLRDLGISRDQIQDYVAGRLVRDDVPGPARRPRPTLELVVSNRTDCRRIEEPDCCTGAAA